MKKIFIDTNVIIDLLLKRDGYAEAALIMESGKQSIISLHASVLTMANLAYILRKELKGESLYQALRTISSLIHVTTLTDKDFQAAIELKANDFEDALQYFCAFSNNCECIITRNEKDFSFSKIQVLSTKDFLTNLYPDK